MKHALLTCALLVGCAEIVGVRDIPGAGSDAGDAASDAPNLGDAPACSNATVALTSSSIVDSISTSSGFLYAQVSQTGVARCAVGVACSDPPDLLSVAADETFASSSVGTSLVYTLQATSGGSVHRAALDGTADQVLLQTAATPSYVAASGARTFWIDDDTGDLHCLGCAASDAVWVQALSGPDALVADSNAIYALAIDSNGDLGVYGCSFSTACASQPRAVVQGLALGTNGADIASDDINVYVADRGQPYVVAIDAVGAQTTMVGENAQAIAVDRATGDLFYAAADGTLARVKTDGSKTKTALTGCSLGSEIDWLAFDATNVYALVPSGSTSYAVYAVPRK